MGTIKQTTGENLDEWTNEDFEESISSALISLYESKIVKQRKCNPKQRLDESAVAQARKIGLYIPNPNRVILTNDGFDIGYKIPLTASLSVQAHRTNRPDFYDGYRHNYFIQRVDKIPPSFTRTGGGVLFKFTQLVAQDTGGIDGCVHYFSVDKLGKIFMADFHAAGHSMSIVEPHILDGLLSITEVTLNFEGDKINCWTIEGKESEARCAVSVDPEQVKSLLYARQLPMTVTGRKRPILHLVSAHRRRIKEGIDIDINKFLRGVNSVEMNGTLFTVTPPKQLIDTIKK